MKILKKLFLLVASTDLIIFQLNVKTLITDRNPCVKSELKAIYHPGIIFKKTKKKTNFDFHH